MVSIPWVALFSRVTIPVADPGFIQQVFLFLSSLLRATSSGTSTRKGEGSTESWPSPQCSLGLPSRQ